MALKKYCCCVLSIFFCFITFYLVRYKDYPLYIWVFTFLINNFIFILFEY